MNKNQNMHAAKRTKNDEFYTQLTDIEKELKHYKRHFKNKIVLCNCDNPKESNFWQYFSLNFEHLGLKKLIATYFDSNKPTYKLELYKDINGDGHVNQADTIKTPLKANGDFRSPECIEILKEADIVVTNPPFSLFREYIEQLIKHNKKFLIIGNKNSATNCKEIFPLFLNNKIWFGITSPKSFLQPDGSYKTFGNIGWYTNLEHAKRTEDIILYKTYEGNEKDYPKYDGYDIINIDKVKDIPIDYKSVMGVPITFLDKYNPNQFTIVGMCNDQYWRGETECIAKINGKSKYARLLIKRKEKGKTNEN